MPSQPVSVSARWSEPRASDSCSPPDAVARVARPRVPARRRSWCPVRRRSWSSTFSRSTTRSTASVHPCGGGDPASIRRVHSGPLPDDWITIVDPGWRVLPNRDPARWCRIGRWCERPRDHRRWNWRPREASVGGCGTTHTAPPGRCRRGWSTDLSNTPRAAWWCRCSRKRTTRRASHSSKSGISAGPPHFVRIRLRPEVQTGRSHAGVRLRGHPSAAATP